MATLNVQRRTDSTYVPITVGEKVLPGESIRIFASDIVCQPTLSILDAGGNVVVSQMVPASPITGEAWLDTVAPTTEGVYTATLETSDYWWLACVFPYTVSFLFQVAADAPAPPPPSNGDNGLLSEINDIINAVTTLVVVGMIFNVMMQVQRYLPEPKSAVVRK